MITITTNSNIQTELSYSISGKTPNGWRIDSTIVQRSLIGAKEISRTNRTWTLIDTPSSVDEEGNVIEGSTEYTDWRATWTTDEELEAATYAAIMAKAGITEWDGSVIEDIENDPNAAEVQPWVVGELVAPPNKRSYEGTIYDVIQAHTTQISWIPPLTPALWNVSLDQGGEELPTWSQPSGAQDAYPMGAQVSHNGQCWENTGSPANVWEPGVFGWVTIECP